jgi:translation elongation factor EF-4
MKANRPTQAFIVFVEPALNQIANHRDQFVEIFALRRHFRLVARCNEHIVVPLDLKNEFFLHVASLAHETDFDKGERRARKLPQQEGKKRMKAFGSVNLPQEAFIEVLKA